jgi:arylsulfatase A-like enzyme
MMLCYITTVTYVTYVTCRFGYDAIHLEEATMGNVMQQAGYVTGHYGKW